MPTTVTVDGTPATNVAVVSPTQLTATTPPGAAVGDVDVVVTTSGGSATAADVFEYVDEPRVNVIVPDGGGDIDIPYNTPTNYITRIQNFGTDAADVTDMVTLHSEGGPLTADQIVLESEIGGGGGWVVETPVEQDGDLVYTDTLTLITSGTNNRGQMRIMVADTVTDLTGNSTLSDAGGVLATADYTFNLLPEGA